MQPNEIYVVVPMLLIIYGCVGFMILFKRYGRESNSVRRLCVVVGWPIVLSIAFACQLYRDALKLVAQKQSATTSDEASYVVGQWAD